MNSEKDLEKWCDSFKASKVWLTAVQSDKSGSLHTQKSYCRGLKAFCDWIKKTPDELIAERKRELKDEETEMNAENTVRSFCVFLEKKLGKSRSTVATKYHAVIRSFYKYNNAPLKLKTPKYVTRVRQPHTVEEIKALLKIADVRERAFIMLLKDSGMSREDVVTLKYGDIKSEYESNKDVIHIKVVRQKESLEYDTFLGANAIESLKDYLEYRQRKGEHVEKDTLLMVTVNGKPMTADNLSCIFLRLSKDVGFMTSPHRFRRFFETYMGLSCTSFLVKNWMGHSLGVEKSYFLPPIEVQRKEYASAYQQIDLYKAEVSEVERRKQSIRDNWAILHPNATEEETQGLENVLAKAHTIKELNEGIRNITAYVRKKDPESENDCQKVIGELELETWLAQGWKFVSVLPSGKIVVSNE